MPAKLSLIVPCYNEEQTLAGIVDRILTLQSADLALEIVIVDDSDQSVKQDVDLLLSRIGIQAFDSCLKDINEYVRLGVIIVNRRKILITQSRKVQ